MDELARNRATTDATVDGVPIRTLALTIVASLAALFALRIMAALLAPLLVSVLLAYALEPAVSVLTRRRPPRGGAIVMVAVTVLAAVAVTGEIAAPRIAAVIDTRP